MNYFTCMHNNKKSIWTKLRFVFWRSYEQWYDFILVEHIWVVCSVVCSVISACSLSPCGMCQRPCRAYTASAQPAGSATSQSASRRATHTTSCVPPPTATFSCLLSSSRSSSVLTSPANTFSLILRCSLKLKFKETGFFTKSSLI